MARIRTIKPEFWVSEQVASCCRDARLLFIGMWNFADDNGVHPKSCKRLKMEIFPGDDVSEEQIATWVSELINTGLLIEYTIGNQDFWQVTGWKKHQRIDKPHNKYPVPCLDGEVVQNSTIILRPFDEQSTTIRRTIDEESLRKGKEGKGEKEVIGEVETSPVTLIEHSNTNTDDNDPMSHLIAEVFEYWKQVMKHPKAKLDRKRRQKVSAALKQGFTSDQLKQAIDGCRGSEFHMGQNSQRKRYDDIGLILRDAGHIEQFIDDASGSSVDHSIIAMSEYEKAAAALKKTDELFLGGI